MLRKFYLFIGIVLLIGCAKGTGSTEHFRQIGIEQERSRIQALNEANAMAPQTADVNEGQDSKSSPFESTDSHSRRGTGNP